MKYLNTSIIILFAAAWSQISSAQEICTECNLPPKSIGAGGLTFTSAAKAFNDALVKNNDTPSAKDVISSYDQVTYTLVSEVYGKGRYGMQNFGTDNLQIRFRSTFGENPITGELLEGVVADFNNIMGSCQYNSLNNPVLFLEQSNDACMARPQYIRYSNYWAPTPTKSRHYFNYHCRIIAATDALICAIKYDGNTIIGYQVYRDYSSEGGLPEGILE